MNGIKSKLELARTVLQEEKPELTKGSPDILLKYLSSEVIAGLNEEQRNILEPLLRRQNELKQRIQNYKIYRHDIYAKVGQEYVSDQRDKNRKYLYKEKIGNKDDVRVIQNRSRVLG